eukprot:CAMPEP_0176264330 /NCGR_PEP_ID=MMETSP0121_2-20121125/41575_2 /TAXON_ID=160619 /ORGANISM="Kryptoperidinium foliaceum, Strain CCMP 1326" /LENGTH=401 /DNA_ID=CAMNT_0017604333 /DNA_START=212 /DNA_END=1414 /DNA_ORIENTATION=-
MAQLLDTWRHPFPTLAISLLMLACMRLPHQDLRVCVRGRVATVVDGRLLARNRVHPLAAVRLREVDAVCDGALSLLEVVEEDHDLPAAGEHQSAVGVCGQDLDVRQSDVVLLPDEVQIPEKLVRRCRGVVPLVPEGRSDAREQLLNAVVDDGHALGEHRPNEGVVDARDVTVAHRRDAIHVVVVNEVAQRVHAAVWGRQLLLHALAEEGQVECGVGEPLAAETGQGGVVEREVEHAREGAPIVGLGVLLEPRMVRQVRRRDLANYRDLRRLLQLGQEVEGHECRSVEPQQVDVVLVDEPPDPLELLLADEGVGLVQVAEVIKPPLLRDRLVVALALVVARHAVRGQRILGARALGVVQHLALAIAEGVRAHDAEVAVDHALVATAVAALRALRPALRPHGL